MKQQLEAKWLQLAEKLNQLNVRERSILLVIVMVLMLAVFDHFSLTPYLDEYKQHKQVLGNYSREVRETQMQIDLMLKKMAYDPNLVLKQRIDKKRQHLQTLQQQIVASTDHLIAPEKMSAVIGYLLSRQSGLKVRSVKNMPAEPITFKKDEESDPVVFMYKHQIHLVMEGSFFQVADYLRMIESLDEQLYWDDMRFSVERYPTGLLSLKVHTLSLSDQLIGVYD